MATEDQPAAHAPAAGAAIARKRPPKTRLDKLLGRPESGVVLAAVAVRAFFAAFAPHFAAQAGMSNILLAGSAMGIIAVGVATLMIAGQFDLSVGSVYGLSAGIVVLMVNAGMPGWAALPAVMLVGLAIGAINGFLVTRLEIHSLIITLGALMFYCGVMLAITEGFPIRLNVPDPFLKALDLQLWGIPACSSGSSALRRSSPMC